MNRSNVFQATNPARAYGSRFRTDVRAGRFQVTYDPVYPEVPAMWPNRAVRRAVKLNRMSRVPTEWLAAMAQHQGLRAAIKGLA